jgi:hypothetical protein
MKDATAPVTVDMLVAGAPVVRELHACLIATKLAQAHGLHVSTTVIVPATTYSRDACTLRYHCLQ